MGASVWPDGKTHSDWYESAGLLMEVEKELGSRIVLTVCSAGSPEHPDLSLVLTSFMGTDATAEPVVLGSVRYLASTLRLTNWKGLISFLLYQLDFETMLSEEDLT